MFRRYHYLNHGLNASARTFIIFYNDKPVAHMGFLKYPCGKGNYFYLGHRGVTLPDYQGIGVFARTLNIIAKHLMDTDKKASYVQAMTSNKVFAKSLENNPEWRLSRAGRVGNHAAVTKSGYKNGTRMRKSSSSNRNTFSFRFIGAENDKS